MDMGRFLAKRAGWNREQPDYRTPRQLPTVKRTPFVQVNVKAAGRDLNRRSVLACQSVDSRYRCQRQRRDIQGVMLICRACGVEPYAYLRHLLTELSCRAAADDIRDLLPFNYAAGTA